MNHFDRRTVLIGGGLALMHGALPAAGSGSRATTPSPARSAQSGGYGGGSPGADAWPSFPSTDAALVRAVVGASHSDLQTVTDLVTAHPALARASIDWGFGDWESALGAAAHMGRRDIAEVLIGAGARPNVFSAAMLGQLDVVRAFVAMQPGIQRIPGPHGISLLSHARAGGDDAAAVYAYLDNLGDADPKGPATIEMSDAQRAAFLGSYAFGSVDGDTLTIEENRGRLTLRRAGQEFGRRLFPVSASSFYPSGAWDVRIEFELEEGRAERLRVIDHEVVLTAERRD